MRTSILFVPLALAACSAPESDAASRAKFIAAGVNAIAPKSLGDGMRMTKAAAEGETLILSFDGIDPSELALPDLKQQMKQVICADQGFRTVIKEGVDIELDLHAVGGSTKTLAVDAC